MRLLRNWTLPVAISVGLVLYLLFGYVPALAGPASVLGPLMEWLLPWTIFLTLFVTFSKIDFHLMRLRRWHFVILGVQLLLIALLTWLASAFDNLTIYKLQITLGGEPHFARLLCEAMLVCVIAPCASASPVVTGKLGGDVTQMTAFVLLSSAVTSFLIPAVFPLLEPQAGGTFAAAFLSILRRIAMVLLLPLVLGAVVRHYVRPLYLFFVRTPDLAFYLWSISLAIVTGVTARNIVHSEATGALLAAIAVGALLTAVAQFAIGRSIGRRMNRPVCCGQGMFQKNTGLAIWIAYTYLTPVASVGAGCYVLWQNIINSIEIWAVSQSR